MIGFPIGFRRRVSSSFLMDSANYSPEMLRNISVFFIGAVDLLHAKSLFSVMRLICSSKSDWSDAD